MKNARTTVADSWKESDPSPFPGPERSLQGRAERRPRTLLFIPRFKLASTTRVVRALRHALASAGGYTVALGDPSSAVDVFVDIVIFREAVSQASQSANAGGLEDAGFARAMLESVDASFCMVVEGSDTYLTSDAQPLIERMLEGASQVLMGAVWRTHRPSAPSGRWSGPLLWLMRLLPRRARRDVLSGLFLVEGGPPSLAQASYFVAKNGCTR
jgi:hypothetical protein